MTKARSAATRPLVVVTGSSGLIGSRLCKELARSFTVVGLDHEPPREPEHVSWIPCDLTDEAHVVRAIELLEGRHGRAIASVIHLAAYYDFSGEPSPLYEQLTVEGTRRLVRGLRRLRVEQFVFSSSLLVMKPVEEGEVLTEDSAVEAEWAYPRSKLAAETVLAEECGDIPVVILRIAGVYDEDCNSIPIAYQMQSIFERKLESHVFPGKRSHGQSFVHVADLIGCIRAVVERRGDLEAREVFLVGEPEVVGYDERQDILGLELHGKEWATFRIPAPVAKAGAWVKDRLPGQDPFVKPWMIDLADAHMPVSIERVREKLGWQPRRCLRDVLPDMARRLKSDPASWYEKNGLELPSSLRQGS